jgi:hypothetical protein
MRMMPRPKSQEKKITWLPQFFKNVSVEDVLEKLGEPIYRGATFTCPGVNVYQKGANGSKIYQHGNGTDKNPSAFYNTKEMKRYAIGAYWKCRSCGCQGDAIKLVQMLKANDGKELSFDEACSIIYGLGLVPKEARQGDVEVSQEENNIIESFPTLSPEVISICDIESGKLQTPIARMALENAKSIVFKIKDTIDNYENESRLVKQYFPKIDTAVIDRVERDFVAPLIDAMDEMTEYYNSSLEDYIESVYKDGKGPAVNDPEAIVLDDEDGVTTSADEQKNFLLHNLEYLEINPYEDPTTVDVDDVERENVLNALPKNESLELTDNLICLPKISKHLFSLPPLADLLEKNGPRFFYMRYDKDSLLKEVETEKAATLKIRGDKPTGIPFLDVDTPTATEEQIIGRLQEVQTTLLNCREYCKYLEKIAFSRLGDTVIDEEKEVSASRAIYNVNHGDKDDMVESLGTPDAKYIHNLTNERCAILDKYITAYRDAEQQISNRTYLPEEDVTTEEEVEL